MLNLFGDPHHQVTYFQTKFQTIFFWLELQKLKILDLELQKKKSLFYFI